MSDSHVIKFLPGRHFCIRHERTHTLCTTGCSILCSPTGVDGVSVSETCVQVPTQWQGCSRGKKGACVENSHLPGHLWQARRAALRCCFPPSAHQELISVWIWFGASICHCKSNPWSVHLSQHSLGSRAAEFFQGSHTKAFQLVERRR